MKISIVTVSKSETQPFGRKYSICVSNKRVESAREPCMDPHIKRVFQVQEQSSIDC